MEVAHPEVSHIAQLGNLELAAEERDRLASDFRQILEFINELEKLDLVEVPITSQVTELENVYRPDEVVLFEHHRTLLEHAPHRHQNLIKVPGVFHSEENDGAG
ncbi:MAG: Asp-tRNA(Asn)/Glu-tRNA(Gln) amidotransferase subunit GatC [Candidatus Kerfeldbacteria bacterium]|nr:Asp-tRNA(Asn)/Glu-tRNA(Gln) amidotransferase subunit GatC [Candidatus Kerfeldbacteria bacterium]